MLEIQVMRNMEPVTAPTILEPKISAKEEWLVTMNRGSASRGESIVVKLVIGELTHQWRNATARIMVDGSYLSSARPIAWYAGKSSFFTGICHFPIVDTREGSNTQGHFVLFVRDAR